jgi:hypothetical protein
MGAPGSGGVPMGVGPGSGGVSEGVSPDSRGAHRAIIRATPTRPNILHFILFPPYYIGPSWLEGRLSETLLLTLGHIIQLRNLSSIEYIVRFGGRSEANRDSIPSACIVTVCIRKTRLKRPDVGVDLPVSRAHTLLKRHNTGTET